MTMAWLWFLRPLGIWLTLSDQCPWGHCFHAQNLLSRTLMINRVELHRGWWVDITHTLGLVSYPSKILTLWASPLNEHSHLRIPLISCSFDVVGCEQTQINHSYVFDDTWGFLEHIRNKAWLIDGNGKRLWSLGTREYRRARRMAKDQTSGWQACNIPLVELNLGVRSTMFCFEQYALDYSRPHRQCMRCVWPGATPSYP